MPQLTFYISYIAADKNFVNKLAKDLKEIANAEIPQFDASSSESINKQNLLKEADVVLIILSSESCNNRSIIEDVLQARFYKKKLIGLINKKTDQCDLKNQFDTLIDFSTDYKNGLKELSNNFKTLSIDTARYHPSSPAPSRAESNPDILRNIIMPQKLRFPKEFDNESTGETYNNNSRSIGGAPSPKKSAKPQHTARAKPPMRHSIELPASDNAGKILYDIPDNMMLNQQQKCVVRIGKTEVIVRDNDTFSGSEKVEDVTISKVMDVELIDINEPKCFNIKTINSAEQEIDDNSFSEWLFWVTPLLPGKYSLWLKVSVIKMIDGKECRKELVFEKDISIAAQAAPTEQNAANTGKDLLAEKNVKELNTPTVFISCAHKDKDYFDAFAEDLRAQSGWNIWTDKNIEIGSDWFNNIQQAVKNADMAVLLISAYFFSSAFIQPNEYTKFIDLRKDKTNFVFLPVLLRDTDINRWQDLSKLQFFSADGSDYDVPQFKGKLLPFAALCSFNAQGELNENAERDTYFKNFVSRANEAWLKANAGNFN